MACTGWRSDRGAGPLRLEGLVRVVGLFAALVAAACSRASGAPQTAEIRVVIYHTADLHGRIDNLPRLAGFLKAERERGRDRGAVVRLVDSGDWFQGTPEGDLTRGRLVVDLMNAVGYDASCPGNHDFDFGPAALEELASRARFPFLASNVALERGRSRPTWLLDGLRIPEARVELKGLANSAMDGVATSRARRGLTFQGEVAALRRLEWTPGYARVLLTHAGIERDRRLPAAGLAAVLGGHTHTRAVETLPGGAVLLHSGAHGTAVGRLELTVDGSTGQVLSARAELLDLQSWSGPEDKEVRALVRRGSEALAKLMQSEVGRLAEHLSRGDAESEGGSSPLGNALCDVLRETAGADVALLLRSSIRASLRAGRVTFRDLYQAHPFPDSVSVVEMNGRDLERALERSVADEDRILLEVSGLEFSYRRTARPGSRIAAVTVGAGPLDPRRTYRVATTSFLAEGTEAGLLRGARLRESGTKPFLEEIAAWIRRGRMPPNPFRNRIARVD